MASKTGVPGLVSALAIATLCASQAARAEAGAGALSVPRTVAALLDADIIRIPVPVPVPVPARRPGAVPPDEAERAAWREARAEFLARARLAMLPPPDPAPGVIVDVGPVPPIPRLAERPSLSAFIMPFENGRISSLFNRGRVHPAIDLAGRLGTPVFSTSAAQTVTFAGGYGGYGNAVITRDTQGRVHLYGHLSAIATRVGTTLAQGERLGALGSTGYSTGPHVHYEVKDAAGRHIDPAALLFPGREVSAGFTWTDAKLRTASFAAAR